jgi:hypothetical protein
MTKRVYGLLRFGLDATGLVMANQLHNVLGPILMVSLRDCSSIGATATT